MLLQAMDCVACPPGGNIIFFLVQNKQGPADDNRLYNSHVLVDDSGSIAAVYRKVHLFDIDVKDGPKLKESDMCIPGNQIVPPVHTPVGNIGLAIVSSLNKYVVMVTWKRRIFEQILWKHE